MHRFASSLCIVVALSTGFGHCAEPGSRKLPLVAVMPLEARQVAADEALILSEALATELQGTGELRVMERSQMDKILSEQGFQQSGACSGTDCAVQVGQLLGIDRMVVGSVGHLGKTFVLVARMVNVGTGEVMKSTTRQAVGEIDQILTTVVPQVASDLLGRTGTGLPPPEIKFSSTPNPDLWTDSVIIPWQATSRRGLMEVSAQIHGIGRQDSAIARTVRPAKGNLAHGDFLLVLPPSLDSGAYVLRLVARDEDATATVLDFPVRRHVRIAKPSSHWGWWLFGGVALIGGTGAAAWVATHQNSSGSNNQTPSPSRSLVVSWQ